MSNPKGPGNPFAVKQHAGNVPIYEPDNSIRTGPWQPAQSELPGCDSGIVKMPAQIGLPGLVGLGRGRLRTVYQAHDAKLNGCVAIKVPHRRLVVRPKGCRKLPDGSAECRQPGSSEIVPVFDAGSTDVCPCFIVSKFIAGRTLAQRIQEDRPSFVEAAELVATVAEAVQYARRHGLVHRDIKPSNILLDTGGTPHIADFGVALKEEHVGQGPKLPGLPLT